MFVHSLIKNLKRDIHPYYLHPQFDIKNTCLQLFKAEAYYFGDLDVICDMVNKNQAWSLSGLGSTLRLPFNSVTFSFSDFNVNGNGKVNICLLITSHIDHWEVKVFHQSDHYENGSWIYNPYRIVLIPEFEIESHSEYKDWFTVEYGHCEKRAYLLIPKIIQGLQYITTAGEMTDEPDFKYMETSTRRILYSIETMMRILICKNIIVETVRPKKKRKSGNIQQIHPYNVFKVIRNGVKYKSKDDIKLNDTIELTNCPGHFKTYTEAAPLFGRHVGTWWWSPWIKDGYDDDYRERHVDLKP